MERLHHIEFNRITLFFFFPFLTLTCPIKFFVSKDRIVFLHLIYSPFFLLYPIQTQCYHARSSGFRILMKRRFSALEKERNINQSTNKFVNFYTFIYICAYTIKDVFLFSVYFFVNVIGIGKLEET